MKQPYPVWIAIRYLRNSGKHSFISFISLVSMVGIGLAVAVLIATMSVINGFETELERRILGMSPDAGIAGYGEPLGDWQAARRSALARSDIVAAAPFVEGQGLVVAEDELLGVNVRGIEPDLESGVTNIADRVTDGTLDALRPGDWNVVIGRALARELDVGLGERVVLMLPSARVTLAGLAPRLRSLTVAGIFDVGMAEFDLGLVLMNFDDAAALYATGGRASGIGFDVTDIFSASTIANDFAQDWVDSTGGQVYVDHWMQRHENVFRSIQLTKPILFIMLSLVVAVAAFNIVSTLFMVVREKRGDVAILRSFGATPASILRLFTSQGTIIGLIGTLAGVVLGLLLVRYLGSIVGLVEAVFGIDLLSADAYPIGDLETEARFGEIVRISLLSAGLAVLATIYPSILASRLPPAEALRNE